MLSRFSWSENCQAGLGAGLRELRAGGDPHPGHLGQLPRMLMRLPSGSRAVMYVP